MSEKLASPLPQAAHIRVSGVQGAAQTNHDAKNQQDGRALRGRHGPEGDKKDGQLLRDAKTQTFQKDSTGPKYISIVVREQNIGDRHNKCNICIIQCDLVLQQMCELIIFLFFKGVVLLYGYL